MTDLPTIPISGKTRVLMIAADPIGHVRTPQAINAIAQARGSDTVMVPCHVDATALPALLEGLRGMQSLAGLVVTSPHKVAAAALCDELSDQAALAGVVNAIRRDETGRLIGDIFDGRGFVAGLRQAGHKLAERAVFMAGAGGAANAIAVALADAGIARLVIHNRTEAKARELADRLRQDYPYLDTALGDRFASGVDIAVNATSLGLNAQDPHPFDLSRLNKATLMAEVVMQPAITPLLQMARDAGFRIQPGGAMLEQQLALLTDFFGI